MTKPAHRLETLPPYPFALLRQRVRALNAQGKDVIDLDAGSPDMPPAPFVIEALARSAANPRKHGYAGYRGTTEFRAAVAAYYQRRFGVTVDPETQILPLLGSKEGVVNLALAYLDRGDLALVPEIGYPAYSLGAVLAGGDVCWLPCRPDNGFLPDVDAIPPDALRRAKLLWLNYPNNPTGAVVDLAFYQRMVDFCAANDLILASDNPYFEVSYDGYSAPSALQADGALDCAVEFMSFSKTYNMAGWRLGAAVGNAEAISRLLQVKSNIDSGHFSAVYDAGIAALEGTTPQWIAERNLVYQHRRDRLLNALPQFGLTAAKPQGALYLWGRVGDDFKDGAAYVEAALAQAHVSFAPGSIYGPGGEGYVRLTVCVTDDRLEEALKRLKAWYSDR